VRLFLAINLPPRERQALHDATAPLRAAAGDVAWVAEERLHLTLKFLGEQREEHARRLGDALAPVVARHRSFAVDVGGAGAFPNLREPRVVWMGVTDDPKLELLHHDVEATCAALGHEVEGRPFRAHITLGRVRQRLSREAAQALRGAVRDVSYDASLDVRSVDVMRSALGGDRARYHRLAALPLAGGA
jgi:2'-5' RNA ligase